jgi:pyruvate dehydrogenase E2 component (dihydrolipoamide acetyltransferase)
MVTEVVMPQLGTTTLEGKIIAWLKQEGDRVVKGEPLFEVETDKANMEVESLDTGILRKILVHAGDFVKVTEPVAIITEGDEDVPDLLPLPAATECLASGAPKPEEKESGNGAVPARRHISPLARKIASQAGLVPEMLNGLSGGGIEGAINKSDVLRFLSQRKESQAPDAVHAPHGGELQVKVDIECLPQSPEKQSIASAPPLQSAVGQVTAIQDDELVPLSRMRRAIAERMTISTREVPQFWMGVDVSVGALVKLRETIDQRLAGKVASFSYTDFIIKAVAGALRECPFMNVSYTPGGIARKSAINVGFAVALEEGLIVPVIRNAGNKSLSEIAGERNRLTEDARKGVLSQEDITGGTFTVSNLGMFKVDQFVAILNPPETGILSVGRIRQSLALLDGQLATVPTMSIGLTIDHRSIDGAQGAKFLEKVIERLEEPILLLV